MFSSAFAPKLGHALDLARLGCAAQVVERLDPELLVQQVGALGSQAGDARDGDQALTGCAP